MKFEVRSLISLYNQILKDSENNALTVLTKELQKTGKYINVSDLLQLAEILNDKIPYLGYVTEEVIKHSQGAEIISLSEEEIKFYSVLAKKYKKNAAQMI